jgi:hypothetical protein
MPCFLLSAFSFQPLPHAQALPARGYLNYKLMNHVPIWQFTMNYRSSQFAMNYQKRSRTTSSELPVANYR